MSGVASADTIGTGYRPRRRIPEGFQILKAFYFAASTLPAISRVTENGHYPSQALLGWGLAYLATSSIVQTEEGPFKISPYMSESGIGVGVTYRR